MYSSTPADEPKKKKKIFRKGGADNEVDGRRTDIDKLDGGDFGLEPAEGRVELRVAREFPEAAEDGGHGVLEGGAGALVGRDEPLFEAVGGRDALGGGEAGAAVDELCGVLEGAAAGVVKGDVVDEAAFDHQVRLFEVGDVVGPGRGDRLQLFGRGEAHAELDALEDFALCGWGEVVVFDCGG
jgi:hypothetical protein